MLLLLLRQRRGGKHRGVVDQLRDELGDVGAVLLKGSGHGRLEDVSRVPGHRKLLLDQLHQVVRPRVRDEERDSGRLADLREVEHGVDVPSRRGEHVVDVGGFLVYLLLVVGRPPGMRHEPFPAGLLSQFLRAEGESMTICAVMAASMMALFGLLDVLRRYCRIAFGRSKKIFCSALLNMSSSMNVVASRMMRWSVDSIQWSAESMSALPLP